MGISEILNLFEACRVVPRAIWKVSSRPPTHLQVISELVNLLAISEQKVDQGQVLQKAYQEHVEATSDQS